MTSRQKKVLTGVVGVIVVVLMGVFIIRNWGSFSELEITRPELIVPLLLVVLANLYANGMLMSSVLRPLDIDLNSNEAFSLSALNRLGNYLAPMRLGVSVRIAYLHSAYSLSVTRFLSSLTATYVVLYMMTSFFGFLALGYLSRVGDADWNAIGWGFLALFLFLWALVLFVPRRDQERDPAGRIGRLLDQFARGWNTIVRDRRILRWSGFWAFLTYASFTLMTYFEFQILGTSITLVEAAFITSVGTLQVLIGITPAGLGVGEALVVIAATSIGFPAVTSLAAALLQRVVVFATVTALAPFCATKLFPNTSLRGVLSSRDASTD